MIEKALIAAIFMYATSFALLGGQYVIADVFGYTMTDIYGNPIKTPLLALIDIDSLNTITDSVVGLNQTSAVENPVTAGAEIAIALFQLLTGTYIFNVLTFMGLDTIWIVAFSIIYVILIIRAFIAYIRGV